ncbi:unnamed protein product [Lactuca virosa]|uniref:PGG domain-containing protein n=1 Tax=Lactuca virosa TaxID=75947 RepID=A0AAU9PGY8_9ASTR|nr:unnamed protein product [Lactuca virosa]
MRMALSLNPSSTSSSCDASSLYPDPFHANVSNFVSVKLSSERNYRLWEKQMGCLLKSYNLHGIVCEPITPDLITRFDRLVKGWIFGSISEELLDNVVELESAKAVWDKLQSIYCPTIMIPQKAETTTEAEVAERSTIKAEEFLLRRMVPKEAEGSTIKTEFKSYLKLLRNRTQQREKVNYKNMIKEAFSAQRKGASNSDGNTVLHIMVGIGFNYFVNEMLSLIDAKVLLKMQNQDGSTALHIAAIVGNKPAAELLLKKNKDLLETTDHKNKTPLDKAFENMHLSTVECLLKAANDDGKTKGTPISVDTRKGVNLLVNAISAKKYDLAKELIKNNPEFAVEEDDVLMAIAKTFPSGLNFWETFIYPSPKYYCNGIVTRAKRLFYLLERLYRIIGDTLNNNRSIVFLMKRTIPLGVLSWIFNLICILITMVYLPFVMVYFCLWEFSKTLIAPIKTIEKKKKEPQEAKEVLKLICDEIDNTKLESRDAYSRYYTKPFLEAARQNAYQVVDEILKRCPEAIRYTDKSGYDIIQLSVIHRSEKIYELIYELGSARNVYKMMEDSSKNNLLHLVGRLPPWHKLKLRTGAALQLQRELQWREEVKKMVSPAYHTKENIFNETPDMVFTNEHKNLVLEAEMWMKTVAESCSITAGLITTIVFAAAITVPGGNHQDNGFPMFAGQIPFTIFGISVAISLFASTTALLMFQSILTGRFSEEDFLDSLPSRLIFGLFSLMISTTAMIVAFSTTLFLVFCHKKLWMLAPIGVLAFLPIASFLIVQIRLTVDLLQSTYGQIEYIFEKYNLGNSITYNPNDVSLFFRQ